MAHSSAHDRRGTHDWPLLVLFNSLTSTARGGAGWCDTHPGSGKASNVLAVARAFRITHIGFPNLTGVA